MDWTSARMDRAEMGSINMEKCDRHSVCGGYRTGNRKYRWLCQSCSADQERRDESYGKWHRDSSDYEDKDDWNW